MSRNGQETVMRYTFHVSSSKRSSGTNSDFTLQIPNPITRLAKDSQLFVSVHNIQVPFSFFQLPSTNNINILPVYIKNAVDIAGKNVSITLTPGNWTAYTIIDMLNSKLTEACLQPSSGYTPFTPVFGTVYSPSTSHMTFIMSSPVGCEIHLKFANANPNLGSYFGCTGNVVMTTSTAPESVQPCVLTPINYLLLRSSLSQYRNREYIYYEDASDILLKFPIQTLSNTWCHYEADIEPILIVDPTIQSINFYLTDQYSFDAIDLRGIPWSFSFSIIEKLSPVYTALADTRAIVMIPPSQQTDEKSLEDLEKQRKEILQKIDVYKAKLTPKPLTTSTPSKTVEQPKQESLELKDQTNVANVFKYASSSKVLPTDPSQPYNTEVVFS